MNDAVGRYNSKWLDISKYKNTMNDLGGVDTADFRRGQGGLYCKVARPFNASNAPDLFGQAKSIRHESNEKVDFGHIDRWEHNRGYQRYKRTDMADLKRISPKNKDNRNQYQEKIKNAKEFMKSLKSTNNKLV